MLVDITKIPEEEWTFEDSTGQKHWVRLTKTGIEFFQSNEAGQPAFEHKITFHAYLVNPAVLPKKLPEDLLKSLQATIDQALVERKPLPMTPENALRYQKAEAIIAALRQGRVYDEGSGDFSGVHEAYWAYRSGVFKYENRSYQPQQSLPNEKVSKFFENERAFLRFLVEQVSSWEIDNTFFYLYRNSIHQVIESLEKGETLKVERSNAEGQPEVTELYSHQGQFFVQQQSENHGEQAEPQPLNHKNFHSYLETHPELLRALAQQLQTRKS